MTDESAGLTEPWIEKHQATYAYGYDKGGALARALGVTGLPSAVLVDSTGTIVFRGHPGELQKDIIEKNLAGALTRPLFEWPESADKVKKALRKKSYAKALEEATALQTDGAEEASFVLEAVQSMIRGNVSAIEAALQLGDYLTVSERGADLEKALKGLPEEETVAAAVKTAKTGDAKKIASAQLQIRKILAEPIRRPKDALEAAEALQRIADRYEGSYAAKQASEEAAKLRTRASGP